MVVRLSVPRFGCVLVASGGQGANFSYAPKCLSSNVGTVRVVTEIFSEQFVAPVWSREARFDGYLRNRRIPLRECFYCLIGRGFSRK